jgi:polar amino acid transport system permease protein
MPVSSSVTRLLWSFVLFLGVSFGVYVMFAQVHYAWNWSPALTYGPQLAVGWLTTLGLSLGAMVVSILVGFTLMIGRRSPWVPVQLFCTGAVEILRGSPLLVQLLVGYYIVATALRIGEPLLVGMVLLGCFEGAYLAEIFRGAVESIGASQREAARAVGFDATQTYRYVIIPQAIRRALPGTTGQMVSLIKDSSLLSIIGIEELVKKVESMNSASYTALEGYLPLALAYLIVTLPLSWYARQLERRFAYET